MTHVKHAPTFDRENRAWKAVCWCGWNQGGFATHEEAAKAWAFHSREREEMPTRR